MATAPVKPTLTAPPTEAPHKRGQNPVEFDNRMQPFVDWVCTKWFPDAKATNDYMEAVLSAGGSVSGDAAAAAASASAASTAATNAAASATAANTSKTNAAASATNAANSATAAASSATAADGSKTAAATSATNAANSAGAANTSKTAAGTSETNAAASATAANSSKIAAGASETNAAASATAANSSKIAAGTSETNAGNAAASASASATAAGNAKTAAEQAAADAAASAEQAAGGGEPSILPGTTAQYFRGDKSWRDFATDVRAAVLTGLSTASAAAVTATDSVLVALGKLQKQVTDAVSSIANKVDKDGSKVLSTNDYTTAEKNKLASIQANAAAVGSTAGAALGTAAAGSATTAARSDHAHALPTPAAIGLGNVNNTSDANKPVSTAQQAVFDAKAPLVTPTITGLREAVVAIAANNIDLATTNRASKTINGNTTFTISNPPPAGYCQAIVLRLTVTSGVPTFWSGLVWDKGSPPTFAVGKTAEIAFLVGPGGASTTAALVSGDSR